MENFIEFMYQFTKVIQGIMFFMLAMIGAVFSFKCVSEFRTNKDPKALRLLYDAWETIGKQDRYIKQLEAQISRDRESLIKEGENDHGI